MTKEQEIKLRRKDDNIKIIKTVTLFISVVFYFGSFLSGGFWISALLGEVKGIKQINQLLLQERVDNSILNQKVQAVLDSELPKEEKAAQILWTILSNINDDIYPIIEYFTDQDDKAWKAGVHLKKMQKSLKMLGIPVNKTRRIK